MNQFRCKQLSSRVVLGFNTLAISFFTVPVQKIISFRAETVVQLRTSRVGHWICVCRCCWARLELGLRGMGGQPLFMEVKKRSLRGRGTQVVRERSAKPLRVGSIPPRASTLKCP